VGAEPHLTAGDQGEWLDQCDRDHANLRAALRWAIEAGEVDRAQEAAGALSGAGGIAWWQEDMVTARAFYEEALAIERELGDPARIAEALYNQGFIVGAQEDFDAAVRLFEESLELFRRAGDESGMARAEWMIVIRDLVAGDLDHTVTRAEEAIATWRRVGDRFQLETAWSGWPSSTPAQAAGRTPGRPCSRPWSCSVGSTAPWGWARSSSAWPTWPGGRSATRTPCGWPAPRSPLRERVGGGAPVNFLAGFMGDPEAEARAHLPQEVAQRAIKEGRTMSVDAALALAVGEDATTEVPRDPA
jgi:tetratricopeptide (TPR) repeat protein